MKGPRTRTPPGRARSRPTIAAAMAETMVEQWLRKRSGILTATRGKLKRLFCFEDGRLALVASNVIEEQAGAFLVRDGLLTPADLADFEREAAERGLRVTRLLAESGALGAPELEKTLRARTRELAAQTLEWPDGRLQFERGQPNLDGELSAPLPPVDLLVDYARRYPSSLDVLRVRLGKPDQRLHVRPQRLEELDQPELEAEVAFVLERCASGKTLGEVMGVAAEDLERTLRGLHVLRLLGVVLTDGEIDHSEIAAELPVTRAEVMARVAKADGADHYQVLGIARDAAFGDIRSAYYQLARRLHPDRFRAGELGDLLPSIERFFSQVTEAYNTLSDRQLRTAYDTELETASAAKKSDAAASDTSFLARQNFLRGQALAESKRYSEALKFLQNAVDLDGTQARYFLALGLLQSRNPRLRDEAERNLLRVTEIEPTAIVAYLSLGNLYRRAGRNDQAVRMYREVLRWDPGNEDANEGLASVGAA